MATGTATCPLAVRINVGAASTPVRMRISDVGSAAVGLRIGVADAGAYSDGGLWRPVVVLNGVDISTQLTGGITVQAAEGEARIAEFTLLGQSGMAIPTSLIGRAVTIDFALKGSDGSAIYPRRLFTGVVDKTEVDVVDKTVAFRCTDDLQNAAMQLSRADIDLLCGGRWALAAFREPTDNWQYLTDRMSTVAGSVDRAPDGSFRVTQWASKPVADLAFTASNIEEASLKCTLQQRADVCNKVTISYSYQFPRYKIRQFSVVWKGTTNYGDFMHFGQSIVFRSQIKDAIDATGWEYSNMVWDAFPVTAVVDASHWMYVGGSNVAAPPLRVGDGLVVQFNPAFVEPKDWDMAAAQLLCTGVYCMLSKRFVQAIDERYTITVRCQPSIDIFGELDSTISASLSADSTAASTWESTPQKCAPLDLTYSQFQVTPCPDPVIPIHGTQVSVDYNTDPATGRPESNNVLETLIAKARTAILATHRRTRIGFSALLNPAIDVDKTVSISTPVLSATGKVRQVVHGMSIETCRASTDVEIAVCALHGTEFSYADTVVSAPPPPAPVEPDASASFGMNLGNYMGNTLTAVPYDTNTMFGYFSNHMPWSPMYHYPSPMYPDQFTVQTPEIDAASRDNAELPVLSTFDVALDEDVFTLTL